LGRSYGFIHNHPEVFHIHLNTYEPIYRGIGNAKIYIRPVT